MVDKNSERDKKYNKRTLEFDLNQIAGKIIEETRNLEGIDSKIRTCAIEIRENLPNNYGLEELKYLQNKVIIELKEVYKNLYSICEKYKNRINELDS